MLDWKHGGPAGRCFLASPLKRDHDGQGYILEYVQIVRPIVAEIFRILGIDQPGHDPLAVRLRLIRGSLAHARIAG